MCCTIDISLELGTEEAFGRFGSLIAKPTAPSLGTRQVQDYWRLPFGIDGAPELEVVRYWKQPWEFAQLEQHIHVTEGRIPLRGQPFVLAVAEALASESSGGPADAGSVRAFLFDGSAGLLLHKGTWHSLDCFPVGAKYVDMAFLTEAETVVELEEGKTGYRTRTVNYSTQFGLCFRISDNGGLTNSVKAYAG